MSNQLRTDSPDNDSAFSDTISLISSEQSSSSSSSATANVNITDKSRTSPSSQAAPNEPNSLVSCSSSVINVEQNSKPPSSLVELPQQQLFFESKNGDSNQKDDSVCTDVELIQTSQNRSHCAINPNQHETHCVCIVKCQSNTKIHLFN